MQLKSDFCVWPAENCDMVVFLALYGFLTSERHFFLGYVSTFWRFEALHPLFEPFVFTFLFERLI